MKFIANYCRKMDVATDICKRIVYELKSDTMMKQNIKELEEV